MLLTEFGSNTGTDTGLPSDGYKRAVLRAPPSRFSVEFLPPTKNGSYNHGMRITPITFSDDVSVSSRARNVEYEIWRRWEDCLWLQETLEKEYKRAAHEKKVRLQQGKGVKAFNGIYKQDLASSWESLPPGPDPNSIVQDVHGHLPKLSKKGTLFRPNMTTIENRQKEFQTLVETLFSDTMPALIKEIRASPVVTDFFGFWRRDYDAFEAANKGRRNSFTSSVFSSYFSESNPSLLTKSSASSRSSTFSSSTLRTRQRLSSTSSGSSDGSDYQSQRFSMRSDDTHRPRRRPLSATSSDSSSSARSDASYDSTSTGSTDPAIVDDVPVDFGHNPQQSPGIRPNSILEILPEEREMLAKTDASQHVAVPRRPRASNTERKANRGFSIIGFPSPKRDDDKSKKDNCRESWQSNTSIGSSADVLLEGLDLTLPHKIREQKFRASIASVSTFMTTDSADAIIPRASLSSSSSPPASSPPPTRKLFQSHLRISTPLSLSDFEIYSEDGEQDERDYCESILDSFPRPNSYIPQGLDSRPDTPTTATSYDSEMPNTPDSTRSVFTLNPPPSPTTSTMSMSTAFTGYSTTTTGSSSPGTLSIKAAYNSSIILLRVPRETPLHEIRQRLFNKFVGQEGIPLPHEFGLAFVPSTNSPLSSPVKPQARSNMRSRADSLSSSSARSDRSEVVAIDSDMDWHYLISTMSGKITLRILDLSD